MKIQNKQTPVSKGVELNDKDYMNRLLTCLKELVKGYATVLTEVSNDYLLGIYYKHFENVLELQRKTYDLMFANGWYQLESVDESKLNSKLKTLQKELQSLNCEEDDN